MKGQVVPSSGNIFTPLIQRIAHFPIVRWFTIVSYQANFENL